MKKIKALLLISISYLLIGNTNAATIDNIEATTNNTIELTASPEVIFSDINVEGEVKLLKDVSVSFSSKDMENNKKVLINLNNDLTANTKYSLISILGAEGNIDFSIGDFLQGEIYNSNIIEGENGIEKINIIDSRTIELYFNYELKDEIFEFKILSEIPTNSLKSAGNNVLSLETSRNLEKETNYIVMILTLEDAMGNEIIFEEDLYDLFTPATLEEVIPEEEIVLAAAEEEEEIIEEGNIEEVALATEETPETGTTTSLLIMLAIIANLAFFFRKRFMK